LPVQSRSAPFLNLPRTFLVLSLVFGNLLVFLIPPFQSADEPWHFYRAYEISEGGLAVRQTDARGIPCDAFPVSLYKIWLPFSHIGFHSEARTSLRQIREAFSIPLEPNQRMLIALPNTSHYSPVCYLPQSIGIALGRLIGAGPLTLFYLGREGNLLGWILAGYVALRCAPIIAPPIFLLLLMPMPLYLATTNSADAPTSALTILFTAMVFRYSGGTVNSVGARRWLILLLLSVGICLCKFVYAPLLLLLLLIPIRNFGSGKKHAFMLAILVVMAATAWAIWTVSSSAGLNSRINGSPNISPADQLHQLEQNPLHFAAVLWATFAAQGWTYLRLYVGLIGWYDVLAPAWLAAGYIAILFFACLPPRDKPTFPTLSSATILVLPAVLSSLLMIAVLSYLYWTQVGAPQIDGIHGRYLIPLSPAVFILVCAAFNRIGLKSPLQPRAMKLILPLISLFTCIYWTIAIWNRYYN
jgi:uncharacterized membrane protein